jgi:hypothetical protein
MQHRQRQTQQRRDDPVGRLTDMPDIVGQALAKVSDDDTSGVEQECRLITGRSVLARYKYSGRLRVKPSQRALRGPQARDDVEHRRLHCPYRLA